MSPATNRNWLETFIELYKSEPCLWKTKSPEYYDRNKKDAAYEKLVKKFQEIEAAATRDSVIKKINNIRCTYKKERNKVVASMAHSNESVYEPRLWYYPLLSFLDSQELHRSSDIDNSNENTTSELNAEQKMSEVDWNLKYLALSNGRTSTDTQSSVESFTWPQKSTPRSSSDHGFFPQQSVPKDDAPDTFGKLVSQKLRELSKEQALLAEKIIFDTLFEANMGRLTVDHRVQCGSTPATYCTLCESVLNMPQPVLDYEA